MTDAAYRQSASPFPALPGRLPHHPTVSPSMTRPTRRSLAAALLCIGLGGCAAPGGLGHGETAPPVSSQSRPEPLWPLWTDTPNSSGTAVAGRVPPPQPLDGAPAVGPEGIEKVDVRDILRADKAMKQYGNAREIVGPGKAGVRPPRYADLTGDGNHELIVAGDSATGHSVLSVYTAIGGKIVPILLTGGRRMSAEIIDRDLLIRTADDGSTHMIRYHWDGRRMSVLSDEHQFGNAIAGPTSGDSPAPRPSGSAPPAAQGPATR